MLKEERIRQEVQEERDKLEKRSWHFTQEENELKNALHMARENLKEAIIANGLGKVDNRDEINKTRAVIRSLEEQISELPIIQQAIDKRIHQISRRVREADHLEEIRERYEALKLRLQECPEDSDGRKDLAEFAARLEEAEDYKAFLKELDEKQEAA